MIEALAAVVRTEKGKAWVRLLDYHGGCGGCKQSNSCRAPQLAEMFRGTGKTFTVDDPFGLRVDEQVKILIDDDLPLRAAASSYGLGTLLILGGAALGVWLAPAAQTDLGAATGLILGIAITSLILCIRARRRGSSAWRLRVEREKSHY
jgi:sigma-E factor negative regulatory protein RseC